MADDFEITDRDIEVAKLKDAAFDFLGVRGAYGRTKRELLKLMASTNESEVMIGNVIIRKDKYYQLSVTGSGEEED